MTLSFTVESQSPLARLNPLAPLGAAVVVMLSLVATLDPVTPALLLGVEAVVLPLTRVPLRRVARRAWPVLLGALGVGVANLLTGGGLLAAVAVALRLSALALPGVVVLMTVEPVDLADALVQQLHAPARFAYGALAALRLLPLLGREWETIGLARRARGIDAGRSPVAAARLFASRAFGLLVAAVRRGVRLATAMDARGFGTGPRSYARVQRMRAPDWAVLVGSVAVVAAVTAASVALGQWQPVLG